MGQGYGGMAVDTGHGFSGDHGVDDCLFGGLDGGEKQWIEAVVGQHFEVVDSLGRRGSRIGGGEGDEDVAGAVAGVTAVAAEAERRAARHTLQLGWNQRGVGRDHDNN